MAQPMRWVNETLPPRARARWLLMTTRLSNSNLTGIARTLVAVGTARLASMFCTVRAAAPRRIDFWTSPGPPAGAGSSAGVVGVVWAVFTGTGFCSVLALALGGFADATGAAAADDGAADLAGAGAAAGFVSGAGVLGASVATAVVACVVVPLVEAGAPSLKNVAHLGSTDAGSSWNRSYISSTSH